MMIRRDVMIIMMKVMMMLTVAHSDAGLDFQKKILEPAALLVFIFGHQDKVF